MPNSDTQIETTLADLAINMIFDRTPGLADHYLGFELVPGSVNEEKTRAAGLLGFRVGNEELYIPVLFLNGKVKGTEVIYLKNADVFTSNSKQWIDYLTTRDTGVMGGGDTPRTPIQQPSPQGLSVFSKNPANIGKTGFLGKEARPFMGGLAEDFWMRLENAPPEWTDIGMGASSPIKTVLQKMGRANYQGFLGFLDRNPELLSKVANVLDLEKDIMVDEWPAEIPVPWMSDEQVDSFLKDASAAFLAAQDFMVILPEDIEELGGLAKKAVKISPEAVAELEKRMNDFLDSQPGSERDGIEGMERRMNDARLKNRADFDANAKALEAEAKGIAGRATGLVATPIVGAGLGGLAGAAIGGLTSDDEDKTVKRTLVGGLLGSLAGGGLGLVAAPAASNYLGNLAAKTAAIESLTPEQKEECYTNGFLIMDKRAADEKTIVLREEYRTKFGPPCGNGFYEIINRGGDLKKAFVAKNPFLIEDPKRSISGSLILDVKSGVYASTLEGDQVFVRSRESDEESVWKGKFPSLEKVSSMSVNKSYMLVSPSMQTSSPFKVSGKVKGDSGMHFVCRTPWELSYRGSYSTSPCLPCSSSDDGAIVKIVERDDVAPVSKVGSITYVPSSWRVIEVYDDSLGLEYGQLAYDGETEESKKRREDRTEKSKIYRALLPGGSDTVLASLQDKGTHELTLHKDGSLYQIRVDNITLNSLRKKEALLSLVEELGIPQDDASTLLDETLDKRGHKVWVMNKSATLDDDEILPVEGLGSNIADLHGFNQWGLNRAGRARQLARASGTREEDIPFTVRRPLTSMFLSSLGGSMAGALAGGLAGGILDPNSQGKQPPSRVGELGDLGPKVDGRTMGALLGSSAGGLLGLLLSNVQRHGRIREIRRKFDRTPRSEISSAEPNKDVVPGVVLGATGLAPTGWGHAGERDTHRYLKGKTDELPRVNTTVGVLNTLPFTSLISRPVSAVYDEVRSSEDLKRDDHEERRGAKRASESADEAFERLVMGNGRKTAAGPSLNSEGLIYGGMQTPEMDPGLGVNMSGVQEIGPVSQEHQVPLNNLGDPTHDWRDLDEANWDKISDRDLQFLMRVADSKSTQVLESSMINLILKTNRVSNQIDEWMPDFVNSLDSKGRMLLMFYWHNARFAEDYGKDEMAEFEDVLLNSIKVDGQLILFLKQKAGESSSSKIDAFAGN